MPSNLLTLSSANLYTQINSWTISNSTISNLSTYAGMNVYVGVDTGTTSNSVILSNRQLSREFAVRFDPVTVATGWAQAWGQAWGVLKTPEEIKREKRREARAAGRARKLLREHLTDVEHQQLAEEGYFEIESESGRRYRIYQGFSRNIVEIDPETGLAVARLCAHGGYASKMPTEDHMLAQKLMLQAAEKDFRKIANISRIGKVEAQLLTPGAIVPAAAAAA